jgi:hypothetical protein
MMGGQFGWQVDNSSVPALRILERNLSRVQGESRSFPALLPF